jgi:paired amphipathic helix protein Sin3a
MKEDTTFTESGMDHKQKWACYIQSYVMVEPTEGVPVDQVRGGPFLQRNIPKDTDDSELGSRMQPNFSAVDTNESLLARIAIDTYHMDFEKETSDWMYRTSNVDAAKLDRAKDHRKLTFEDKLGPKGLWMKDITQEEAEKKIEQTDRWLKEGPESVNLAEASDETIAADDVEMSNA